MEHILRMSPILKGWAASRDVGTMDYLFTNGEQSFNVTESELTVATDIIGMLEAKATKALE